MADFNRPRSFSNNRSFGRRDFKKRSFSGQSGDRPMYPATCSNCGQACQVPFQPTGNKPVFCSDCFEKNNSGANSGRFPDRNSRRPNFDTRNTDRPQSTEQFTALHAKLDKILSLLGSIPVKTADKSKTKSKPLPKNPVVVAEPTPTPDADNQV